MAIEFKALPPEEAVAYFKAKGHNLDPSFDWRDVWQQTHATSFTVAKSAGFDILKDIHAAVLQAQSEGRTFDQFKKDLTPILQAKGWWGRKEVTDPITGENVSAQLGSPRRLRIIYDTNLRMNHAAGEWAKIQRTKQFAPFLRYVAILDGLTRPLHRAWHGTVLPVDHAWWKTHFPPNGWLCRCTVQQLSEMDLNDFGYQVSPDPEDELVPWTNDRTGEVVVTPRGVDPGFGYNPGQAALDQHAARALMGKLVDASPDMAAAQAASARFVVPAVRNDLAAWISDVAAAVEDGRPATSGNRRVVGALSQEVLDFLEGQGTSPESGAITMSDKDITHAYRETKRDRGETLSLQELAMLPDVLAAPKAVLWDKRKPGLIYLFDKPDGVGKVVVTLDYKAKVVKPEGGREAILTNNLRTAKIISGEGEFQNKALYELIEGGL